MSVEDRLAAVEKRLEATEKRLQAADDQLEIIRLLNSYGPLVDSGESQAAARLWIEGGVYNIGGVGPRKSPEDLVAIYEDKKGHQALIHTGSAHLTATPRITLNGDTAEAVAYSFLIKKEGDDYHGYRWQFMRAAANHWTLVRTPEGWRIKERYNRPLDGSKDSHDVLRKALS
jgi:hypothetical protein